MCFEDSIYISFNVTINSQNFSFKSRILLQRQTWAIHKMESYCYIMKYMIMSFKPRCTEELQNFQLRVRLLWSKKNICILDNILDCLILQHKIIYLFTRNNVYKEPIHVYFFLSFLIHLVGGHFTRSTDFIVGHTLYTVHCSL